VEPKPADATVFTLYVESCPSKSNMPSLQIAFRWSSKRLFFYKKCENGGRFGIHAASFSMFVGPIQNANVWKTKLF